MKILIFNWRDIKNPTAGGAEVFTHENAKRLVKKGNEVTLFSSKFKNCERVEMIDGIEVIRAGGNYSVYLKAKEYYEKYFSRERFDVVIDEINTIPFFTPKFVDRGEKIVCLIHQLAREYWFYETPFPLNFLGYYFLEKNWLKNYIDIPTVTVSRSTKSDLMSLGFKKVFIVPEGLAFKPFKKIPKKEENPTVVYLGRLKRAKRVNLLIRAFLIVKKEISDANLWIAGEGYLKKKLKKISCDEIRFFGYVSGENKINLLSRAWVIVNPSVREGWGLNVIEANACGTPCIAYDVPGLRDSVVDGKTGLLVKEDGNVEALAQAITKVLEDEKLRNKLSRNALKWAGKFDWDRSAKEFEKVIKCH